MLIRHNCQNRVHVITEFLLSQSVPKYTLPVYRSLVDKAQEDAKWKWLSNDIWKDASGHLDFDVQSEAEDIFKAANLFDPF